MRRVLSLTAVLTALTLTLAGCGGSEDGSGRPAGGALSHVSASGSVGERLEVTYDAKVSADSPESTVLDKGHGNPVKANESALLQLYIGNGSTGKQAVNTYEQGPPVQIAMREDQFFKPVLDAVVGKPAGSRVAVVAPVRDVWGAQGAPQFHLTAKDTAVFVADIVSVQPVTVLDRPQGASVAPPANAPRVVEKNGRVVRIDWSKAPKKAPGKLTVIPLVKGDGPAARAQSMVTFDYYGAVYGAKTDFDESYSKDPVPFGVGVNGLIPAWDKAIPGLTRGSRVLIIAPPSDGYGDQERPGIPAGSTLVFVVDVLGVDG